MIDFFRHKILKMLPAKGRITPDRIVLMGNWRHTGFNAHIVPRILSWHRRSMNDVYSTR